MFLEDDTKVETHFFPIYLDIKNVLDLLFSHPLSLFSLELYSPYKLIWALFSLIYPFYHFAVQLFEVIRNHKNLFMG